MTWTPGEAIDADEVAAFVREGARVAAMSRGERFALAMAEAGPED